MNFIKKIIDARIEKEYLARKFEIEERLRQEESRLRQEESRVWLAYQSKIDELNKLNTILHTKICEVKQSYEKAEEEQKRLWERLDILRDNLNSEQVWMKVWECAFSKAVTVVWGIMKDKTVELIDLAVKEKEEETKDKLTKLFHVELDVIREGGQINKPLLLIRREELHKAFLAAERSKDQGKMTCYKAQMEIVDEIAK